jgi:hypothetical protein
VRRLVRVGRAAHTCETWRLHARRVDQSDRGGSCVGGQAASCSATSLSTAPRGSFGLRGGADIFARVLGGSLGDASGVQRGQAAAPILDDGAPHASAVQPTPIVPAFADRGPPVRSAAEPPATGLRPFAGPSLRPYPDSIIPASAHGRVVDRHRFTGLSALEVGHRETSLRSLAASLRRDCDAATRDRAHDRSPIRASGGIRSDEVAHGIQPSGTAGNRCR